MARLLVALTAAPDPELVGRVLAMAEHKELLLSLVPPAVMGASRSRESSAVTWAWLQRNLDTFAESFRGSGRTGDLLEKVLPRLGIGRESEVQGFFRNRTVAEGSLGIAKGLELLAVGSGFRKRLHLEPA
jgi:tricorn protease interacting factor F2/3